MPTSLSQFSPVKPGRQRQLHEDLSKVPCCAHCVASTVHSAEKRGELRHFAAEDTLPHRHSTHCSCCRRPCTPATTCTGCPCRSRSRRGTWSTPDRVGTEACRTCCRCREARLHSPRALPPCPCAQTHPTKKLQIRRPQL